MNTENDKNPAEAPSDLTDVLAAKVPFCSEELNDLMSEFMSILVGLGMTEVDDIIDTAIARCCVKKGRVPAARKLIETAFEILHEHKVANAE